MPSRAVLIRLFLAASAIALVALGAGWRSGAARVESERSAVAGEEADAAPAQPPTSAELRPGATRPVAHEVESDREPVAGSAGGAYVRRVHVRLADGSDARDGTIMWGTWDTRNHPHRPATVSYASIGAGGNAELLFEPTDRGRRVTIGVVVSGQPSTCEQCRMYARGPIEITLPRGVPYAGTVVDATGRIVPHLPIVVTSGARTWFVSDDDLDPRRRMARDGNLGPLFIEAQTDGAGRFEVRVPRPTPDAPYTPQVLSRDDHWLVVGDVAARVDPEDGAAGVLVHVERGVALDVRASDRQGGALALAATITLFHPADRYPMSVYTCPLDRTPNRVHLGRPVAGDEPFAFAAVLAPGGMTTALVRATVPAGLDEARVDFVVDRLDDEARTGLVELIVPGAHGEVGEPTGYELHVQTQGEPRLPLETREYSTWAGLDRIDVRLPTGPLHLSLARHGEHRRSSDEFKADVIVVAGATTRVTMEDGADQ